MRESPAGIDPTVDCSHTIVTLSRARGHDAEQRGFDAIGAAWVPGADMRPDVAAVAVLSSALVPHFGGALASLAREVNRARAMAVILVPWKEPPHHDTRYDGVVDSFLCDAATFHVLQRRTPGCQPRDLCYALLDAIINQHIDVDRIIVRQLPHSEIRPVRRTGRPAGLIMAHRGRPRHLSAALRFIDRADGAEDLSVRVGLDEADLVPYRSIQARCRHVRFHRVDPAPAGLFVVRQRLLEQTAEDLFYLQDSDDVSCSDRFAAQADEFERTGCDVVGCHELRIDEITRTVEAYRLPLDVQDALGSGYSDSQLNGTILGSRRRVLGVGGYSTHQRIANDTQFMLRAYFSLALRNVDGFYYLRRRHKASLTVAPDTAQGTPLRERLRSTWAADFDAVRAGTLTLDQSSLRPMHTTIDYAIDEWTRKAPTARAVRVAGSSPVSRVKSA